MAEAVLAPGTEIGGCKVLEKLGAGAMGTVFKAHHIALDKVVALKVLNNAWNGDSTFVDRFQREARAAAKLDHPNVVQVYNVGHDHGHYYIVMQYVEGESLQDRIEREGRLSLTAATRIVRAIAQALGEAHAKHLVHRDIKTANILIGSDERPRLTDFGLTRSVEPDKGLTMPGTIMGTPGYIAPEVIEGKPADFCADQYALGVAWYYLLSGTLPHKGKTAYEIFSKQLTDRPAPLASIAPEIPPAIADLVHKLMSRNPEERFPSMRAFVERLDAVWRDLSGGTGAAGPAPAAPKAQPPKPQAWDERMRQIERKERRRRLAGSAVGWIFLLGAFSMAAFLAASAAGAMERGTRMTAATPFVVPFGLEDPRWLPRAATVLLMGVCFSCFFLFARDQFSRSSAPFLSFACTVGALAAFYVDAFKESLPLVTLDSLGQRWAGLWPRLFDGCWTPVNEALAGLALLGGAFLLFLRREWRWQHTAGGVILTLAGSAAAYRFALRGIRLYYPEGGWSVQVDSFYSVLLGVSAVGLGVAALGPRLWPRSSGARLLSALFLALSVVSLYAFGALAASPSAVTDLGWSGVLTLPLQDLEDRVLEGRGYLGMAFVGLGWGGVLFYLPRPGLS